MSQDLLYSLHGILTPEGRQHKVNDHAVWPPVEEVTRAFPGLFIRKVFITKLPVTGGFAAHLIKVSSWSNPPKFSLI